MEGGPGPGLRHRPRSQNEVAQGETHEQQDNFRTKAACTATPMVDFCSAWLLTASQIDKLKSL